MQFPKPLVQGQLLRRYKRFLADVVLTDGRHVTVHCPNPGSMLGLDKPGSEIWLSPATSPARKLPFGWELIRVDGGLVGINTGHPNRLAEEAIRDGRIGELGGTTVCDGKSPMAATRGSTCCWSAATGHAAMSRSRTST